MLGHTFYNKLYVQVATGMLVQHVFNRVQCWDNC